MVIWYILWPFGVFYVYLVYFFVLVSCSRKNLATLATSSLATPYLLCNSHSGAEKISSLKNFDEKIAKVEKVFLL
jgi:hypothetical protein